LGWALLVFDQILFIPGTWISFICKLKVLHYMDLTSILQYQMQPPPGGIIALIYASETNSTCFFFGRNNYELMMLSTKCCCIHTIIFQLQVWMSIEYSHLFTPDVLRWSVNIFLFTASFLHMLKWGSTFVSVDYLNESWTFL
jgi:hypothetical protein